MRREERGEKSKIEKLIVGMQVYKYARPPGAGIDN